MISRRVGLKGKDSDGDDGDSNEEEKESFSIWDKLALRIVSARAKGCVARRASQEKGKAKTNTHTHSLSFARSLYVIEYLVNKWDRARADLVHLFPNPTRTKRGKLHA